MTRSSSGTGLVLVTFGLLTACGGGGGHSSSPPSPPPALSAPTSLHATIGDSAAAVGWDAPPDNGGGAIDSYDISATPALAASDVDIKSTHAHLTNLTNGSTYAVSIRAHNAAGFGARSPNVMVTPRAITTSDYTPLAIQGDTSPSGFYDPSLLHSAQGDLWMSYSSVDYHNNASAQLVQDVGIRLARSADGGSHFTYAATIATPVDATVTDTDPAHSACGAATCNGRWVYETSWLIDDSTDPNTAHRYRLFAHKYFLNPASAARTLYHLGSIVEWTAPALDGPWSAETSLLGWNLTPPELAPLRNANTIDTNLANCIVLAEGSATVRTGAIDFVFACVYPGGNPLPQKIVLLRSRDHASSFQYVSTLLTPADAAPLGASFYTAPSLIANDGNTPILLATPAFNGVYGGCIVFPIADVDTGALFRTNNVAAGILFAPAVANHLGGACAYDPALGPHGMLINDGTPGSPPTATHFGIQYTGTPLLQ
jgi:Fibronectin type III domain